MKSNKNYITVSELNKYVKYMISTNFVCETFIRGEISGLKYHSTGHIYFTLKDEGASIPVIIFKNFKNQLNIQLKDNDEVLVLGYLDYYEVTGKISLIVTYVEFIGNGYIDEKLQKLKEKLSLEGLFDEKYKKKIPKYSINVGVVTSDTGAAIEDIKRVAFLKNKLAIIEIIPTLMQGKNSLGSIVESLKIADSKNFDVIVLSRGGGDKVDMQVFNEELLVRTIFNLKTPLITGIGHEIDYFLADMVADLSRPTPSSACEAAICDLDELVSEMSYIYESIGIKLIKNIEFSKKKLENYYLKFEIYSPKNLIEVNYNLLNTIKEKYRNIINEKLILNNKNYELLKQKFEISNPKNKLTRGYAYVQKILEKDKFEVNNINDLKENEKLLLTLKDGLVEVIITKVEKNG